MDEKECLKKSTSENLNCATLRGHLSNSWARCVKLNLFYTKTNGLPHVLAERDRGDNGSNGSPNPDGSYGSRIAASDSWAHLSPLPWCIHFCYKRDWAKRGQQKCGAMNGMLTKTSMYWVTQSVGKITIRQVTCYS